MQDMFQKTVVFGWSDISLAGSRALLGSKLEQSKLDLCNLKFDIHQMKSQIKLENEKLPSVSIATSREKEISLVSVNAHLNSSCSAHILDGLLDMLANSNVKELVAIASLPIKLKSANNSSVFQIAINCKEVDSVPSLPDEFLIKYSTLNTLIQLLQVEGIPLRCFVTQGYKIGAGMPNDKDGSSQSISSLQKILHSLYSLDFDEEKTRSLAYVQTQDKAIPNLMYS